MKRMSHGHGPLFDVTPNKNLLDNVFKQERYYTGILLDAKKTSYRGPQLPAERVFRIICIGNWWQGLAEHSRHTDGGVHLPAP